MDKNQIAEILQEISVMLELNGENRFKSLAYSNAARTLEMLPEDLGVLIREKRLGEVKGIGAGLCEKIATLHNTGRLPYYEELKAEFPAGLFDCLRVPGLGPKKLKKLREQLNVNSLGDLRLVCERGMVAGLEGFGEKTQAGILEGIANLEKYSGRYLYIVAREAATPILNALQAGAVVENVELAGSLRRRKEVVKDLDFVVSTRDPAAVMKLFTSHPDIEKITNQGETKSSVILKTGIQADLRCVTGAEFPFALAYFTGSKEHNIAMRQRAVAQGKKLNEYGLFEIKKDKSGETERLLRCKNEAEIYRQLGLDYVEPELREDMGEIAAAEKRDLPRLVTGEDIRGCFHAHTTWSDGRSSLEDMAGAAQALGWEYLGIAEHSRSSRVANGLSEKRLLEQVAEIRKFNDRLKEKDLRFRLFIGSEVDVLGDGSLDFSDEVLSRLDFVIISIHSGFTTDESKQTARMIKAMANPRVTMVGHPTGRLLLDREPYQIDMNAVIEAAAHYRRMIELNCSPFRMDMDWRWWKGARDRGIRCAINPDAHEVGRLLDVNLGVGIARKGWLRPGDVLNTRSLGEVEKLLKADR